MRFVFDTSGLTRVAKVFDRLVSKGRDTAPLMDAIGQTLSESAVNRLAVTNESPDGEKWPTSARARVKGTPTQYDSGTAGLAGSITHRAGSDRVVTGSALIYAAQRQFGGVIKPRSASALIFDTFDEDTGEKITIATKKVDQPARPYLGISSEDEAEIGALATDYLDGAVAV